MFFPPSRNDIRGKAHGGRGGRSKVELTAQEELAKAREERERRKRQKLEQKSAVTIQAAWRGWSSRCATRRAARSTWVEQYGSDGERLQAGDCLSAKAGGALARLLFFYRPDTDLERLASVARVVAAAAPKSDAFSAYVASYNVAEARASLQYQLKSLALHCLTTLTQRRLDLAPLLAASRPAHPLDPSLGGPAGALMECVLLLVAPDPFTRILGKPQATSLASAVLSHLAANGMCGHLFHLLTAALLPQPPPQQPPTPTTPQLHHHDHDNRHGHHHTHHHHHNQQQEQHQQQQPVAAGHAAAAKPYIETLTTQLTVRLLALKSFSPAAPEDSPHMLLFVPDLWRRCTSLQPVAARMCRVALTWLAAAGPHRLGTALLLPPPPPPPHHHQGGDSRNHNYNHSACSVSSYLPGGAGAAVAVLLANLLAVGPRILDNSGVGPGAGSGAVAGTPAGGQRALGLHVARVLHAVVSLLPLEPFFPERGGGGEDGEDEADEASCGSLGVFRLVLPPGAVSQLPAGLVEAVQGLTGPAGRQMIQQLVAVLLPQSGPPPPQASATSYIAPTLAASPPPPPPLQQHPPPPPPHHPPPQAASPFTHSSSLPGGAAYSHAGSGSSHLPAPPASPSALGPSPAALLEAAEAAHVLCEFLWQLAQLPGQQQRVMMVASVSCDLVSRMWWSFLKPVRQADLAGIAWLPHNGCSGGGGGSGPQLNSPGSSTQATCSASPSYNCSGTMPIEMDLPSMMMTSSSSNRMAMATSGSGATALAAGAAAIGHLGRISSGGGFGAGLIAAAGGVGGGGQVGAGGSWLTRSRSANGCFTEGGGGGGGSGWRPRLVEDVGWLLPLAVTCAAFSAQVATATLEEFYGQAQRPLPLQQLYDMVEPESGFLAMVRDALWQVLWSDGETDRSPAGEALYAVLARTGGQLYGILYERNCRRPFCPTETFHATALAPDWFFTEANSIRSHAGREDGSTRVWQVLRHAPALVPFADRARLFQQMVGKERQEYHAQEESRMFDLGGGLLEGAHPHHPLGNRFVSIRRDRLLFDGFDNLNSLGDRLRGRVRIAYIDAHGAQEAGVDGGGLFKDFMEELMRAGLSAEYGLFAANSSHQLYPNPAAVRVVEDAPRLLAFLGRMLGKAMYENILLELPLAGFFLKKFRGAHCDLNDLPTLDPDLYRSLLKLREHFAATTTAAAEGSHQHQHQHHGSGGGGGGGGPMEVDSGSPGADLGLCFVVADDAAAALGDPGEEVELKPGGRNIPVTADNVNEYIHRVAHYRLNVSPRPAVSAFLSGFYELIPRSWVSMFSGEELQSLISGAAQQRLDLDDMRVHVVYAGGYHEDHPVVALLWEVLDSFTPEEQGKFLKFVTSCSRAPLLGFKYLEPQLCIQMSGGMLDPSAPQRLPTASTCINLLKLPPYRTREAMRDKLLYAINSGAGFDLS